MSISTTPIRSGVALAVLVGCALVAVPMGSAHDRPQTRTGTITKAVHATTAKPGVPARVSRRGTAAGPYVTKPSKLILINGYRSDVDASHLKWVDWGSLWHSRPETS